jgi:hypothetical protein
MGRERVDFCGHFHSPDLTSWTLIEFNSLSVQRHAAAGVSQLMDQIGKIR